MGVYFLAGIYGVGKSTLGVKLANRVNVPFFSAGDLISEVNGEVYGANKVVADKDKNQNVLAQRVSRLLENHPKILLAGHFCIVNSEGKVDHLPKEVYEELCVEKILLLEADTEEIVEHLGHRDSKRYPTELIEQMAAMEREMAYDVASKLPCLIIRHRMTYSDADVETLIGEM